VKSILAAAKLLTRDEARRITVNIAKLPHRLEVIVVDEGGLSTLDLLRSWR
jgi:hypothetical protein